MRPQIAMSKRSPPSDSLLLRDALDKLPIAAFAERSKFHRRLSRKRSEITIDDHKGTGPGDGELDVQDEILEKELFGDSDSDDSGWGTESKPGPERIAAQLRAGLKAQSRSLEALSAQHSPPLGEAQPRGIVGAAQSSCGRGTVTRGTRARRSLEALSAQPRAGPSGPPGPGFGPSQKASRGPRNFFTKNATIMQVDSGGVHSAQMITGDEYHINTD